MPEITTGKSTLYDDAELTALAVVREMTAESYDDAEGHSAQVWEIIRPYAEKHASPETGVTNPMTALTVALGRLAQTMWTVVLDRRLGHYPTEEEFAAELDGFELHKLEQHEDPDDAIRQLEADEGDADGAGSANEVQA